MKQTVFLLAVALCAPDFASAQNRADTAAAIATYEGAGRMERLIAGAKKEGVLSLYTSIAAPDVSLMTSEFEKKYGIKVDVWRAANDKVLQRVMAEQAAGRNDVDAIQIASVELEALARENGLQEVRSPSYAHLIPSAVPGHRKWAAHYLNVWVQAYNTQRVRKDELPKSYADLLDPRWKGRLGIEAKNEEWFYTVVDGMGETAGLKFFHDLVAANGVSVRAGHSLLNNLVISGEVPLALTVYNYMPQQAKAKGAPIDWFVIAPAIARANGIAVARQAPHPCAAVLFHEFVLSQATQQLMSKSGYVPTHRDVDSAMKNVPIKLVDVGKVLEAGEKWSRTFDRVMKGSK